MRVIIGPSGIPARVSDHVASGLVLAGHARYAGDEPTVPVVVSADPPDESGGPQDEHPVEEVNEIEEDGVKEDPEAAVEEGAFNPSDATVAEVLAYLGKVSEEEQTRILELEAEDKARSSILGWS